MNFAYFKEHWEKKYQNVYSDTTIQKLFTMLVCYLSPNSQYKTEEVIEKKAYL